MNRRLVMVLVFAGIVGLIASFFVYQVVRQMAMAGGPEATEPVVVAAVNMTHGRIGDEPARQGRAMAQGGDSRGSDPDPRRRARARGA